MNGEVPRRPDKPRGEVRNQGKILLADAGRWTAAVAAGIIVG
jgi:hypothetical protein